VSIGAPAQTPAVGNDAAPVTVCITRTARAGCEAAFEQTLHEFVQRSLSLPGQLGVHIMRPAPGSGSREYGVVRKFASRAALEDFRTSSLYLEWNHTAPELTEGTGRVEELTGLESWFTPSGATVRPLPAWKMALVTWLGVNVVTTPLLVWLMPLISPRLDFPWNNFLFNAPVVALLTWVVMPLLTRLLRRRLHPVG
jgi:antibiotic biosynthesis monooxygenase (ABM) superfamily enzyme